LSLKHPRYKEKTMNDICILIEQWDLIELENK